LAAYGGQTAAETAVRCHTGAREVLVPAEAKGHDGGVLPRVLAAAAGAWTLGYLGFYLWLIGAQDGTVAWWYVAQLAVALLALAVAAIAALGAWQRPALTVGFAASALALLVALQSIGALLAPAVVATAVALVVRGRRQARQSAAGQVRTSAPRRRPTAR
jgi:cytochrome bd-type quinol oxidase subunit 2